MSETDTVTAQGISRRSLAAGVAWTAPAILMASAAPAVAASAFGLTWDSAMYSGPNGRWAFEFTIVNPTGAKLTNTSITIAGGFLGPWIYTGIDLKAGSDTYSLAKGDFPPQGGVNKEKLRGHFGYTTASGDSKCFTPATNPTSQYCRTATLHCDSGTHWADCSGAGCSPGSCTLVPPCAILHETNAYTVTIKNSANVTLLTLTLSGPNLCGQGPDNCACAAVGTCTSC